MNTSTHRRSLLPLFGPTSLGRRLRSVVVAALACQAVFAADPVGGFRTFTSTDGRNVTARILAARGTTVDLEFPGGRPFQADVRHFCEADRNHIAAWSPDTAPVKHYAFEVKTTRQRTDRQSRIEEIPTCRSHKTIWFKTDSNSYNYQIRLVNTSSVDLKDVEVRYKLYRMPESSDSPYQAQHGEWEGEFVVKRGSHTIRNLPRLVGHKVSTEIFTLDRSQLDPDWRYTNGNRNSRRDRLAGLWIKVYHQGREVHEIKSSHAALRKARW